ncbi:Uncharacterised protein [Mycobacteroides abscessus subsp. abscessus]|nr:Uncharacterised protein [Mycobacteroides abscessus subsp. abscessus]
MRTSATDFAASPESRSILRNQPEEERESVSRRNDSRAASGSTPSENQSSSAGRTCRMTWAVRDMPAVSDLMWPSAPCGSR